MTTCTVAMSRVKSASSCSTPADTRQRPHALACHLPCAHDLPLLAPCARRRACARARAQWSVSNASPMHGQQDQRAGVRRPGPQDPGAWLGKDPGAWLGTTQAPRPRRTLRQLSGLRADRHGLGHAHALVEAEVNRATAACYCRGRRFDRRLGRLCSGGASGRQGWQLLAQGRGAPATAPANHQCPACLHVPPAARRTPAATAPAKPPPRPRHAPGLLRALRLSNTTAPTSSSERGSTLLRRQSRSSSCRARRQAASSWATCRAGQHKHPRAVHGAVPHPPPVMRQQ